MTVVVEHHPHQAARHADQWTHYYRSVFEWPTTIDTSTGDVRLQLGVVVDALIIRAGLAAEVNTVLIRHMLRVPIIVAPAEPAGWVFLTGPRTTMRQSTWEDLGRLQVEWKHRGCSVSLPALGTAGEGVRWLQPPRPGTELPPWSAVVGAARRAASSVRGTW